MKCASSFSDYIAASRVLFSWRSQGVQQALSSLERECSRSNPGPLLEELSFRLRGEPGPRFLVDCLWLCRPHGGITRVWKQILRTWLLPGLNSSFAPISLIDRNSRVSITSLFPSHTAQAVDPLDCSQVLLCSDENERLVHDWGADVFCSSWISSSASSTPACSEVALLHDFIPERFRPLDPSLLPLRRRWWGEASAHLAVSRDTAADATSCLSGISGKVDWCHPAPDPVFTDSFVRGSESSFEGLVARAGLASNFILLPATSSIGSYKNPEIVGMALSDTRLHSLQLVLCGVAAEQRAKELEDCFPDLRGRTLAAGFSDSELALVFRNALAVLIPSRIEGFGLPAIEVMAAGGLPLIADARGLREAGGEAAMRFAPDQPQHLRCLLQLLVDPVSRSWLMSRLQPRIDARLARLNPDLIGLSLLAQARRAVA